ncbi:MAG TPA: ureidoglycolate lyase [Vicinamibacterales bacterium]|nr:ureidoglycolate lyase [Vicinamibacterales bacterium]
MRLSIELPDASAFAPFGRFIDRPAQVGERRMYSEWLSPVDGLSLHFHTNRVEASRLPLTLDRMERHPHAAQAFLPLHGTRYMVAVMAANAEGQPDPASARAFLMPRTLGVIYHAGTWHAGMTALDDEASFAVLMWRGASDDDVLATIPPLVVLPAQRDVVGDTRG